MSLIEKIGEAIASVEMFARFNDWTGDHVPGLPVEICRYTNNDDIEIVARYAGRSEKDGQEHLERHIKEARAQAALTAIMGEGDGVQEDRDRAARYEGFASWDEADLEASTATMKRIRNIAESYTEVRSIAAAAERARRDAEIVAAIRKLQQDRHDYGHQDEANVLEYLADAIERGEV